MIRGWPYTKYSLSSALLLSFSGMCFCVIPFVLSFLLFCFVVLLSLELCRCSYDTFLYSRPRNTINTTGLATTYTCSTG